jgi:hypothetical protein
MARGNPNRLILGGASQNAAEFATDSAASRHVHPNRPAHVQYAWRHCSQFERELMLERQREGVAKAKAEGKYKGRAPTARAKAAEARRLHNERVGPTEIAKRLQISRASVYRVLDASTSFQADVPSGLQQ